MTSTQERPTPRNPVAPLPAERGDICRLIERDEALLKVLTKEKEERESIVEQNESKEAIATQSLSAINADLARATQFHDILVETLKKVESFDSGLETTASTPHRPRDANPFLPNLTDRMPISRIANDYHTATKEHLLEVESAIEKGTSTASQYLQEVRAAKSLISMTRDDITSIEDQIKTRRAAMLLKKFGLKAIWRTPYEVWALIFQHSTGTINNFVGLNDDWVRGNTSWHGALVISGVCQRWRYVAMTFPRLWANIVLFRGAWRTHDLSRVHCYIERAGETAKTLLLGGFFRSSDDQLKALCMVVDKCVFVDRIICTLVRDRVNTDLALVLGRLPFAPEVWFLRDEPCTGPILGSTINHCISIPESLAMGVKNLVTESTQLVWGSSNQQCPRLHSCSITSPSIFLGHRGRLSFKRTIGRFLASSLPTLKDLRLCAPRFTRDVVDHVAETVLETLHIDLQCLLVAFVPRYTMPRLRELVIAGGFDATSEDYELSKARIPLGTPLSLTIESTTYVGPLLTLILDSTSLISLELRGDSVDVILSSLVENYLDKEELILASLRRLTIDSYAGVGGGFHGFLLSWKASHAMKPHPLELVLFADECPLATLETRKQLCSLAGVVAAAQPENITAIAQ